MALNRMRSTDRILVLERVDPKGNIGLVDPGVFEGKNNLHVVMDPNTCLWSFKYERGVVPPALKNKFTDFKTAQQQAESYFTTKNIKIVEVLD
jgi:hypothetical protein